MEDIYNKNEPEQTENNLHSEEIALNDLISVELMQKIQDAFADMVGCAAQSTDKDGTAVTVGSNFTDFCTKYTRNSPLGKKRCFECDRDGGLLALKEGRSCAYRCHAGLVDFAAPILAGNQFVGSFVGGQVLIEEPDLDRIREIAIELDIDPDEYVEAVKKVKIVDESFVEKASQFLFIVANSLSSIAYNAYSLHVTNAALEQAIRAKSDFLANMSHEIRTPMNAVLGMAEMALREEMSTNARNYLYQIKASGKNLLVIINDILDFSKIESGKMDIVPVTYEPLSMVHDVSIIICSRVGDKDVEFIIDVEPEIPSKLFGDNVRLQQIMINLLNNAIKFTKHGEVKLSISHERLDGENILLKCSVSDTGMGIKDEDKDKLFKSFQQVDTKRNRNIEGTGLGLAISSKLLELMGGKIMVESEHEKGSTFSFEVPQKVMNNIPSVTDEPKEQIKAAILIDNDYVKAQVIRELERLDALWEDEAESDTFFSDDASGLDFFIISKSLYTEQLNEMFKKSKHTRCIVIENYDENSEITTPNVSVIRKPVYFLNLFAAMGVINEFTRAGDLQEEDYKFIAPEANILIVDDNALNLTVAAGLLAPLKMNIDTADGCTSCLALVKQKMYDIIFMDHMMPEVDGIETTHIIRQLISNYEDVPIIALTANALEGTREMFLKEGMNDFVPKPIEVKEITAKIRKWLPQEKILPADSAEEDADKNENAELELEGINVKHAVSMLGSQNLYMTVLRDYYLAIDKKAAVIREHFEKEDWRAYTIEVHSLKSTSRQIGADELSVLAFELEMAGNNNNIDLIKKKTAELLNEFLSLKDVLAPVFPNIGEKVKTEADATIVVALLEELIAALGEFDTLAIDDVVERMQDYEYDPEWKKYLDDLSNAAQESDLEACEEIANNWQKDIAGSYLENF